MGMQVLSVSLMFSVLLIAQCFAQNPDEMGEYLEGDMAGGLLPNSVDFHSRAGLINRRYRWPGNTIPYEFGRNYPQELKTLFNDAISHISSRTCIRFKPRTSEADYVQVISGEGCYSSVGRVGGRQHVSLPKSCDVLGVFVHELIHALGFHHEQSRTDRDDYVRILWENVTPGRQFNFEKYSSSVIGTFGVPYDYGSVMHYSRSAFARERRLRTIEPKQRNVEIGQRRGMSSLDAKKINNMYCSR